MPYRPSECSSCPNGDINTTLAFSPPPNAWMRHRVEVLLHDLGAPEVTGMGVSQHGRFLPKQHMAPHSSTLELKPPDLAKGVGSISWFKKQQD